MATPAPAKPPNVLLMIADDLGYGDVGCFGGAIPTPHIDRLCREGMRFTDAHSSSAVCSPSRYTLLTGRYHWRSRLQRGVMQLWEEPLIRGGLTVASLARRRGFRTACFGKWHLGWDWPIEPASRPFFVSPYRIFMNKGSQGDKHANASTEHQAAWRAAFSRRLGGGPTAVGFDTYFGVDIPNWPPYCFIENDLMQGIPSEFADTALFDHRLASLQGPACPGWTLEPTLPAITDRAARWIAQQARTGSRFLLFLSLTTPHTPLAVNADWKGRSRINAYADLLMETDAAIGRVLEALRQSGAADDTFVLFSSDNGCSPFIGVQELEEYGHRPSGPLRGYKSDAWEGGHRVPLIVRWPGEVAPQRSSDHLVHHADLLATLAEMLSTELAAHEGVDSVSWLPLLRGQDAPVRHHAVSTSTRGLAAVRNDSWKYIAGAGSGGWGLVNQSQAAGVQLYHLDEDLGETRNRAAKLPGRVAHMHALLDELVSKGRSTPGPKQANDVEVFRYPMLSHGRAAARGSAPARKKWASTPHSRPGSSCET